MNDTEKPDTTSGLPDPKPYRKVPRKQKQTLRVPMTDELLAAITTAAEADDREPENMAMRILRDYFIK